MTNFRFLFFTLLAAFCSQPFAAALPKRFAHIQNPDSLCLVWVVFNAKPAPAITRALTPHALARRLRVRFKDVNFQDAPVATANVDAIIARGGVCRNIFKWANAASFLIPAKKLAAIAALPQVKAILPVRSFRTRHPAAAKRVSLQKIVNAPGNLYGGSAAQLTQINVPLAHHFIAENLNAVPGKMDAPVIIGVFDGGFWLTHHCFDYLRNQKAILADSDFVDHDNDVSDPDSVRNNPLSDYYHNEEHGTHVLSLICAYDPGNFMGVAYGASFILARTEDQWPPGSWDYFHSDSHTEEDNWACAMVWAESLGVDIVSSSLGYFDGFVDSAKIVRNGTDTVTVQDYIFSDLDGATTIVSRAAAAAAARGVVIVNAAGNDETHIDAPADVADVLAVGAVDANGNVTGFSNPGPTADGRIKPDLVARGYDLTLPDIYSAQKNAYFQSPANSGTSFAAPLVSGVCALMLQTHPAIPADSLRSGLLAACNNYTAPNNSIGYGIPDAMLACLRPNQSYLLASDPQGAPIAGVCVQRSDRSGAVFTTDSLGFAVIKAGPSLPETLALSQALYHDTSIIITRISEALHVQLKQRYSLLVKVVSDSLIKIGPGSLRWRRADSSVFHEVQLDSSGRVFLYFGFAGTYQLVAEANGFYASPVVSYFLAGETDSTTIRILPRPLSDLIVYPTVITRRQITSGNQVAVEFCAKPDNPGRYSQEADIAVRTLSGTLVWWFRGYLEPLQPLTDASGHTVKWNCRSKTNNAVVAPGVYYMLIHYGGATHIKKILVRDD